ncbi:MAG: ExbD/TolR family protein [Bacteroidales bacterium]
MSKFKRKTKKGAQSINTASLPDIVFMLLFFFMVSTVMRETQLQVRVQVPFATEVKKIEKKSLVSYIYIGKPVSRLVELYGTEPMIQLNDKLINEEGVPSEPVKDFVLFEREKIDEVDRNKMTVSLRIDQDINMGKVTDVKQALRFANALKINYSAKRDYYNQPVR